MSDLYQYDGAEVVILRVPAQTNETKAREIGALFPGWHVWYSDWPIRGMRTGRERNRMVGRRGFEPLTFSVSGRRAPAAPTARDDESLPDLWGAPAAIRRAGPGAVHVSIRAGLAGTGTPEAPPCGTATRTPVVTPAGQSSWPSG